MNTAKVEPITQFVYSEDMLTAFSYVRRALTTADVETVNFDRETMIRTIAWDGFLLFTWNNDIQTEGLLESYFNTYIVGSGQAARDYLAHRQMLAWESIHFSPRRPFNNSNKSGKWESDIDFVGNNLPLAVALLEAVAAGVFDNEQMADIHASVDDITAEHNSPSRHTPVGDTSLSS